MYGESLEDVLPVVRTLPQFVWQRQDQALLRPFVVGDDEELADLKSAGVYVVWHHPRAYDEPRLT
mgnify:CR=1 FL=1